MKFVLGKASQPRRCPGQLIPTDRQGQPIRKVLRKWVKNTLLHQCLPLHQLLRKSRWLQNLLAKHKAVSMLQPPQGY